MIIAIDVGNTNIVLGCLDNEKIHFTSRISTDRFGTSDEYAVVIKNILALYNADITTIDGGIISSVVPSLKKALSDAVFMVTGKRSMVIGSGIKTGLNILIDNPAQLGSDLVVDAVAAIAQYKTPIMVFDMGTATTLSVINSRCDYIGGMIIPGVAITLEALSSKTSQLPYINFEAPKNLIGTNTEDCMKSGIMYGNASMLDGIIERMTAELGENPTVVATGGLAAVITPYCKSKIIVDDDLMLKGLRIIYNKNKRVNS